MKRGAWALVILALVAAIGATVWFWRGRAAPPAVVSVAPPAATVATGQVAQPPRRIGNAVPGSELDADSGRGSR